MGETRWVRAEKCVVYVQVFARADERDGDRLKNGPVELVVSRLPPSFLIFHR